jgi:hypothetical protein
MNVRAPTAVACLEPQRFVRTLKSAGFSFDAVMARLGTRYRQWPPQGDGMIGRLACFIERTSMYTDIGRRTLSPPDSGLIGSAAEFFRSREPRDSLDALIQLFLFNRPVHVTALGQVFSARDLDDLVTTNLIRPEGNAVVSDIALFECAGLFIATDAIVKWRDDLNVVMPLIPESFALVAAVPREPIDAGLDLCTGSGVHALVAARHANHVVGTDINPRAIEFGNFNAWLNGIDNVEFRRGNLFDAVRGETFDLILANPPYMPDTDSAPGDNFFCGGPHGDFLWTQIVRDLNEYLRLGGTCHLIHMIVLFNDQSAEGKVAELLGSAGEAYSVRVSARPIAFRNTAIAAATSVLFGVSTIERCPVRQRSEARRKIPRLRPRYTWRGMTIAAISKSLCCAYTARGIFRAIQKALVS